MPELQPGSEFVGCRIEAVAGRGGMGVVYRATQIRLERPVALKVITPALARDEEFRARFQRESLIAASIEHPNAIPVYEAGEHDGVLYLVMRYVDGTDLRALLDRDGPLDPRDAAELLAPVALALHAAHRRGLVHRDVKPANVLIARDEEDPDHVYLTDFGIARQATDTTSFDAFLTRPGIVVGTVDYMAPERLLGERGDARSDVYSFGCTLFETLAGRAPYAAITHAAKIQAHLNEPPPSLAEVRPDVPEAFDAIVRRATAKKPEDRYETAAAAAAALTEAGRAATVAPVAPVSSRQAETVASPVAAPSPALPLVAPSPVEAEEEEPTTVGSPVAKAARSGGNRTGWLLIGVAVVAAVVLVVATMSQDKSRNASSGSSAPRLAPARAALFTIEAPVGWKRTDRKLGDTAFQRSEWTDPDTQGASLLVDAIADASNKPSRRAENTRRGTSAKPGYQEIAFRATKLGGAAAWEWRYVLPVRGKVVDYFVNQCGDGFAIQGTAPEKSFGGLDAMFTAAAQSLRARSC